MRYIKLERQKVINKVHRDFTRAFRKFSVRPCPQTMTQSHWANINYQEACIYSVEQNPRTTNREIYKGVNKGMPECSAKAAWTKVKNAIDKNPYWKDEHIIGVDQKIFSDTAKVGTVVYEELARGENARNRAKTFVKHIEGIKEKQEDLFDKADDRDLPRRLNLKKKMREQIVG